MKPETLVPRPMWSVMIPAYQPREDYLREALDSVLQQALARPQMQIEVVDDCSPSVDVAAMVQSIGGGRVAFSRTEKNLGLAGCWNWCIGRAGGDWVHLLHHDDYVLPGFYERLKGAAALNPGAALLAARSFYLDDDGMIYDVTERLRKLEKASRAVEDFFYSTPIQCPGVVVRREFYESHGGFRSDLKYSVDGEMWARAVAEGSGVVVPEVLSCYRLGAGNETSRLARTGETLRDLEKMHELFAERYPGFDRGKARRYVCSVALAQAAKFKARGNSEAAEISLAYFKKNAPLTMRLRDLWERWRDRNAERRG